ncbi:hypothetical protein BDR03DRAFT_1019888 [Suillus americanus]|nr:hypothetical protein BDR03DRAFT_1019888 [Suillus americanus]
MAFLILDLTWLLGYRGLWFGVSYPCVLLFFAIVVLTIVLLILILVWGDALRRKPRSDFA